MNEFLDQALNKLAETVSGQKENAMAPSVREALTDFCRQDAEFAQAVAQGGSFKDCMATVAKGVGGQHFRPRSLPQGGALLLQGRGCSLPHGDRPLPDGGGSAASCGTEEDP